MLVHICTPFAWLSISKSFKILQVQFKASSGKRIDLGQKPIPDHPLRFLYKQLMAIYQKMYPDTCPITQGDYRCPFQVTVKGILPPSLAHEGYTGC